MKRKYRRQQFLIALLLGAVIFCIMMMTMQISAVLEYILIQMGIISIEDAAMSPTKILISMCVDSAIISIVLALLMGKYPLRPANQIMEHMNRLAAGDFKVRLEVDSIVKSYPAVMKVTESFNRMAEELENTERLRSEFINNFSHEFKTPIVSIAGFAKLLKRENLTEEQRAEYLDIIEKESLRLAEMAATVLNLTKVENQTILTDVTEWNLSEQLRSCILLLEGKWSRKHMELGLDFDEYSIQANEELLKHVWINLLDNAIKFSPAYGTVDVTVEERKETLAVSIRNTGCEIPPEKQARIFNKFYQADESHASEGYGIGLALVHRIVELHGGTVTVRSADQATTFTVELPKKR